MKYIFLLSGENPELAKEEVLSLTNAKDYSFIDKLLIIDLSDKKIIDDLAKRLAYTHIWAGLKKPKVNLENPKTLIELFFIKNKAYCGLLIKRIERDFHERRAHLRPELHPTSLHPALARCLVNLAGVKKGDVVDPFCGTGGILIEAGLMGLRPIGYDLYSIMIRRAKINLDHYKIKNYKLINNDALKIKKKYDYIVTDPPYGLNTSIWIRKSNKNERISLKQINKKENMRNLELFYLQFLKNLKKILKKRAVIVFPHYVNYRKLIKKADFRIEKEFSQFIHASLTRNIVVLHKNNK